MVGINELVMVLGVILLNIGLPLTVVAGALWLFSRTEFGQALMERLRGSHGESMRDLGEEVRALRDALTEVQERLDFTERLLTRLSDAAPQLRSTSKHPDPDR